MRYRQVSREWEEGRVGRQSGRFSLVIDWGRFNEDNLTWGRFVYHSYMDTNFVEAKRNQKSHDSRYLT